MVWQINTTTQVSEWLESLTGNYRSHVIAAIEYLSEEGPTAGRPFVDVIKHSKIHNLKELRPSGVAKGCRILFVFDPSRDAVLLVAGDKTGDWKRWYRKHIPEAEKLYKDHLDNIE